MAEASTRIAFLWHHHQPDYRDPATGRPVMPWTRLHALRGYRDMACLLLEEEAPMTVNLVPSLIDQLDWYAGGGDDAHLALTTRPADTLDDAERAWVLQTFIAGHPRMVDAHPAYARLRAKRDAGELVGVGDLRDLQVWSTLAWVGWSGLRDRPALAALRRKGSGFTEDDKAAMLEACASLVGEVMGLYRRVAEAGVSEIAASAYYHPILPLLIDAGHALRCLPRIPDEVRFRHPGDALLQLRRGRQRVSEAVGVEIRGLWPSEGSVSPELLPLAAEAGFEWLATDEGVLAGSVRSGEGYGPWDLGHGLVGFFRERDLSDAIGFRYATVPPEQAAAELLAAAASRSPAGGSRVLPMVLDGENPWESYADAGEGFLKALCRGLARRGGPEAVTFSEAARAPRSGRVTQLHTGSWINADFGIWIGDAEDRAAWKLLAETREAVAAAGDPPEALEHVLAAEGSDWFWWFGPEFDTPFAHAFDRLFRAHLSAAWRALGRDTPAALGKPIKPSRRSVNRALRPQRGAIRPRLEASSVSWLRWAGAGYLDCTSPGGAMSPGARHLDGIGFGVEEDGDDRWIWLRLELSRGVPALAGAEWEIVDGDGVRQLRWFAEGAAAQVEGGGGVAVGERVVVARLPLDAPRAEIAVRLLRDGLEIARYPAGACLTLEAPPAMWWA